jgi:integrase
VNRAQRHQKGYVYRKGSNWYLRYYEHELQADGTVKQGQRCHKLVEYGGEYRSKSAVRVLADEFLAPRNNGTMSPAGTMTLNVWIEKCYLPFIQSNKEPSTYSGYKSSFNLHIRKHGDIPLRDVRTFEVERILAEIAHEFDTAPTTIQHVKALLSGAFRYAKRQGILNSENPVRDAVLPKCKETEETYAYSLEEELTMMRILPEPASTAVALAAFTGFREGELRGSLWENYTGDEIRVTKAVWRGHVKGPKSKASKGSVPVIAQLAAKLDEYRKLCGSPKSGWIFPNSAGNPYCFDDMARDVIRPAMEKAGLQWHGWHAFRRGLATNLHRLGVPDKVIQIILRHADIGVTQRCYIKTADADAVSAMQKLEHATTMQLESAIKKSAGRLPTM